MVIGGVGAVFRQREPDTSRIGLHTERAARAIGSTAIALMSSPTLRRHLPTTGARGQPADGSGGCRLSKRRSMSWISSAF